MLKNEKTQSTGEVRPLYEEVCLKEMYSYCNFCLFILLETNDIVSLCDFPLAVFLIAPNLRPHRAVRIAHRRGPLFGPIPVKQKVSNLLRYKV